MSLDTFFSVCRLVSVGVYSGRLFLISTKHEKGRFLRLRGLDFTYLSISVFNVKMLSNVPCIFLSPPRSASKIPFLTIYVVVQLIVEDLCKELA